jgi:membrane protein
MRVYRRSWQDAILDRAAELSYYFAFALLPALLFLTALLGLFPVPDLMPQLIGYADRVLPGDAASLIRKTLAEVVRGASGGLVSAGALVALIGASSGMLSIMKALNAAYGITDHRTWWQKRLIAVALTLVFRFSRSRLSCWWSSGSVSERRSSISWGSVPRSLWGGSSLSSRW